MATYYGVNAGGVWTTGATWSTTAAKDASRTGGSTAPTASDDCILDDYSGSISVTGTSVGKTLNCTSGGNYAGTLTISSELRISGNVTLASTMTLAGSGSGRLRFMTTAQYTSAGKTIVGDIETAASATITLVGDMVCSRYLWLTGATTFAGAYNIRCGTILTSSGGSSTLVAGQTLTVDTAIKLAAPSTATAITIKSSTASSDTFIHFDGAVANCSIANVIFTDVNFNTPVINWCGGALTRTTNIYNATQASFPAVGDVKSAVEYGGVDDASANRLTGTYAGGGGGSYASIG